MSNQIVISSGAKVRSLEGVLTGTAGIVNSVPLGGANGVATLDALGKVPLSQLPASVVTYLGTWNAATNTPTLTNGVGDTGDLYICNVAGTVNFGAGPITFAAGDWVIYSGTEWQKSAGASGTVTSVALTESGDALTITGSPITTSGTINIGFAGTGLQYIKGDGTLATFPTTIDQAKRLITEVYNSTGATLTKGTVVYINGGQGNLPTVTKAQANNDANSAQTYGVVQDDITNMNNGFVVVLGSLTDLDTSAYVVGTQLYLSGTTAGAWTSTKPSAPIHLVYVAIVVRSHPTQGVVEVRIQNGYELEEIHDVAISAPVNNQGIFYNSSNDLWENKSIATALGYTPANDALVVHLAGTETITGTKTFTSQYVKLDGYTASIGNTINFKQYSTILSAGVGYSSIGAVDTTKMAFTFGNTTLFDGRNIYFDAVNVATGGSRTYSFPDINGTFALLDGTQTFTGAKTFSSVITGDAGISLKEGVVPSGVGYTGLAGDADGLLITKRIGATAYTNLLYFNSATSNTYTFPAASGTIALLSANQTFTGGNVFSGAVTFNFSLASPIVNYGLSLVKGNTPPVTSGAWSNIYASSGNNNLTIADTNNTSVLQFQGSSSYTYTFPAATGTIALTSNLSSYVPYTGATSAVNLGIYNLIAKNTLADGLLINQSGSGSTIAGYTTIRHQSGSGIFGFLIDNSNTGVAAQLLFNSGTSYAYTFPSASGTLALTSDLSSYLPLSGGTLTGTLNATFGVFSNIVSAFGFSATGNVSNAGYIQLKHTGSISVSSGYVGLASDSANTLGFYFFGSFNAKFSNSSLTANRTYTLPDANGTLVLGTGTTNYLPKFTGASTIGDSLIFNNGVNTYIGESGNSQGFWLKTNTTSGSAVEIGAYAFGTNSYGDLVFNTSNSANGRMRITAAGNVGIGTSSPATLFEAYKSSGSAVIRANYNGTTFFDHTASSGGNVFLSTGNNAMIFETNSTERMRITSGGSLLINKTTDIGAAFKLQLNGPMYLDLNSYFYTYSRYNGTAGGCIIFNNGAGANLWIGETATNVYSIGNGSTPGAGIYTITAIKWDLSSGAVYLPAYGNGTMSISGGQITTSSDKNLKTDDGGIDNALDKIMKLNPRYFYWKEDSGIETTERQLGFYAQDVNEALGAEVANDNGNEKWGIYDRALIAMLTKSVQELSAKVSALENKS